MADHRMRAYRFYFSKTDDTPVLNFPVAPSSLEVNVTNQNETVTLINEGAINILKKPGLTEVSFTVRFPRRPQPYENETHYPVEHYLSILENLKVNRSHFNFHVTRKSTIDTYASERENTSLKVALEEYKISEDSDEGDDVLVEISLKQYSPYKSNRKKLADSSSSGTNKSQAAADAASFYKPTSKKTKTYTVKKGDTLWSISKKYYGKGEKWKKIYNANKKTIEAAAKKHGYKSSLGGNRIFPKTKLKIPK